MEKIRVGVMGVHRGNSMIQYCRIAENAEVVAICDKWEEGLLDMKKKLDDPAITYYTDFEDFIHHDMDAVVLANYANEHAPFAVRAMKEGKHVFSEVLPVETMREAVALVEAVEETGLVYAYGENYCYMPAPSEMRRLYREGKIGEFEYGEGEYVHNCESIWPGITYGERFTDLLEIEGMAFPYYTATTTTPAFNMAMKLPLILVDVLVGYMIYRLVMSECGDGRKAASAFGIWFLCPIVIYMSSVQAQFDCISALFTLLCVLLVNAAELVKPYVLKIVVDDYLTTGTDAGIRPLVVLGLVYFAVIAIGSLAGMFQSRILSRVCQKILCCPDPDPVVIFEKGHSRPLVEGPEQVGFIYMQGI